MVSQKERRRKLEIQVQEQREKEGVLEDEQGGVPEINYQNEMGLTFCSCRRRHLSLCKLEATDPFIQRHLSRLWDNPSGFPPERRSAKPYK